MEVSMVTIETLDLNTTEKARKGVFNQPQALVNYLHLKQGQEVPRHQANADIVYLVVLQGQGVFNFEDRDFILKHGQLAAVTRGTPMHITNQRPEDLSFIVIKTPSPENIK
jgi:quercetin dioxygenase-like cupin family protein